MTDTPIFDIAEVDIENTSFMHLKHPATEDPIYVTTADGAKAAVGITFHAPGSPAYEAASAKRTNRSLARSKRKIELTADLLRADTIDFLTEVTASFDHLGNSAAGDVRGADLFKAVYADRKRGWVVEQANAHLADWGNALKPSPTS